MKFLIFLIPLMLLSLNSYPDISLTDKERIEELLPKARNVFKQFIKIARKQFPECNIIVAEVYRTQRRQDMLFEKGSQTTTVKISMHTKRLAADIYFVKNGSILSYEEAPYSNLGKLGESFGLRWGGRWKVPFDPGHYEYID